MGGHGTWKISAPGAAKPSYWNRTTADYFYRVENNTQYRYPWTLSDPGGTRFPTQYKSSMASAVAAWQALTEADKEAWRKLAMKWNMWRGYNLFLSRWLKNQI
jgi:hypothetical protein